MSLRPTKSNLQITKELRILSQSIKRVMPQANVRIVRYTRSLKISISRGTKVELKPEVLHDSKIPRSVWAVYGPYGISGYFERPVRGARVHHDHFIILVILL